MTKPLTIQMIGNVLIITGGFLMGYLIDDMTVGIMLGMVFLTTGGFLRGNYK